MKQGKVKGQPSREVPMDVFLVNSWVVAPTVVGGFGQGEEGMTMGVTAGHRSRLK